MKVTENGMGITTIFFQAARAIKSGVEAVVELDTAMVELQKVTNLSSSELDAFTQSASKVGTNVSRTTSEIVEASAMFAKMGFAASEALNLAEQAAVLVNISDGIDDISTASSNMISILKGFNLEATESSRVLDVINETSNLFAVSSSDLTGAMSAVSATLAAQNNTMEESIALVTAANEILQDYSRTATGMRTIALRLTGVSDDNEAIDGLTSSLQKYFDEYNTGVKLMNSTTGEWNSTYVILEQLSRTWDTLTAKQQSNLTQLISGKRQSDILSSALTNRKTLTNSLTVALESEGSAMEENAIYMDGIVAKTNLFKQASQDMWQNTIDDDTIKFFVDLGTAFIGVINKVGLLNIALFVAIGYFSTFGKLSMLIPLLRTMTAGFAQLTFGITASATATTLLTSAMTLGLSAAIVGIIAGITKIVKVNKIHKERLDGLSDAYTSHKSKLADLQTELDGFADSTSSSSKEIKTQIELLKEQIKLEESIVDLKEKDAAYKIIEDFDDSYLQDYKDTLRDIAQYEELFLNTNKEDIQKKSIYSGLLTASGNELLLIQEDLLKQYNDLGIVIKELGYSALTDEMFEQYLAIKAILDIGYDSYWETYVTNLKDVANSTDDLNDSLEDTTYSVGTLTQYLRDYIAEGENTEAMVAGLKEDQDVLNQIFDMTEGELISLAYQYGMSMEDIAKFNTEATDIVLEETKLRLSAMQAEKEALESNYLNNPEARAYLTLLDDDINASLNKIDELQARTDWDFTSTDLSTTTTDGGGTDSATQSLSAYFDQLNKIREAQEEISRLEAKEGADGVDLTEEKVEQYKKLQIVYSEYHDLLDLEKGKLESIVLTGDDEVERLERIEELESLIIGTSTNWLTTQSSINDLMNTSTEIAEEQLDLQKEQEEALSTQKEAVEDLIDLEENRIKQALEDQIDDLEKQIDLQNELVDAVKDKLALEKESADYNDSISDKQEEELALQKKIDILRNDPTQVGAVTEFEDDLDDIREDIADERADREYDVRVDTLDKELEAYEDSKDNEIDVLKAQLDKDGELRAQAIKNISDAIKDEGSVLYDELVAWNNEYGTSIESDIATAWDLAKDALSGYVDVLSGMGGIDANIERSQKIQEMMENSQAWFDASPDERIRLENANMEMGTSLGWTREKGAWYDEDGIRAFGNGGHLTSPEVILAGDESESIIPDTYMGKFLADAYNNISGMMNYGSMTPEYSTSSNTTTNSPSFIINIKGNADKSTISKIQRAGSNMIQDFYKKGQNRPVQALG